MPMMVTDFSAQGQGSGTMLAIIEIQDMKLGCHLDNTIQFVILMLLKTVMDLVALYLCCGKVYANFLSMLNLSICLADLTMLFSMAVVLSFRVEFSHFSLCFILTYFSAIYSMLPLPAMCLLLLDYCLDHTCSSNKRLRNMAMTFLLWMGVVLSSIPSVTPELMNLEYDTGSMAVVCELYESRTVNYFAMGLFSVMILTLVPYWKMIPQWVSEANRISQVREEIKEKLQSEILPTCNETKCLPAEPTVLPPPLWLSMTLGFAVFWMPYLVVTAGCHLCGFGVPPYITVNLLWAQCCNSVIVGVLFWIQSTTLGPYNRLPEDVCSWHIYWQLSKATQVQQSMVFEPTKEKGSIYVYV